MNPLNGTGAVLLVPGERGLATLLGSCFAFRTPTHFLTAAHCVGDAEASRLAVFCPNVQTVKTVVETHKHPTADLAVLQVARIDSDPVEPFWGAVGNYSLGEDFLAHGYPQSVFGDDAYQPTARVFKGHFQRFMEYESRQTGRRYKAAELSIGCPPGLSGGPLFRPGAPMMLTGLATENLASYTLVDSEEETDAAGHFIRTVNRAVIVYGVALLLDPLLSWLDGIVPQRQS